eukprot:s4207_g4.t1
MSVKFRRALTAVLRLFGQTAPWSRGVIRTSKSLQKNGGSADPGTKDPGKWQDLRCHTCRWECRNLGELPIWSRHQ